MLFAAKKTVLKQKVSLTTAQTCPVCQQNPNIAPKTADVCLSFLVQLRVKFYISLTTVNFQEFEVLAHVCKVVAV